MNQLPRANYSDLNHKRPSRARFIVIATAIFWLSILAAVILSV